jgi:hypothetical protein
MPLASDDPARIVSLSSWLIHATDAGATVLLLIPILAAIALARVVGRHDAETTAAAFEEADETHEVWPTGL